MPSLKGVRFVQIIASTLLLAAIGCEKKDARTNSTAAAQDAVVPVAPQVAFPDRPAARMVSPDVEFYVTRLDGAGAGLPMEVDLYLPAGRHEAKSLPCVLIAPAGTAMHGAVIDESDRAEHYPYVRAGFAVVAYELSGALDDPQKTQHIYGELVGPIRTFMKADGGLINGKIAIDYVLQKVPEVDPDQLFACGHSSAADIALNLALGDSRIHACCAYAPRTDVEAWWNDPKLEQRVPGFNAFATQKSPLRHVDAFNCPVYLFHADDDSVVPLDDNQVFADAMKAAGKQITFQRVPKGGHTDSMIQQGIPGGIKFMESNGAKPKPPVPAAG
ncbi:MAG TPA: prolyl oligopeptidase family serine peptidase [Tepidisphaeraceae bacterium]|nr:prolyl oligopeptidase family serine peptidase [Tepidisphaeraceae bacterium]